MTRACITFLTYFPICVRRALGYHLAIKVSNNGSGRRGGDAENKEGVKKGGGGRN